MWFDNDSRWGHKAKQVWLGIARLVDNEGRCLEGGENGKKWKWLWELTSLPHQPFLVCILLILVFSLYIIKIDGYKVGINILFLQVNK